MEPCVGWKGLDPIRKTSDHGVRKSSVSTIISRQYDANAEMAPDHMVRGNSACDESEKGLLTDALRKKV